MRPTEGESRSLQGGATSTSPTCTTCPPSQRELATVMLYSKHQNESFLLTNVFVLPLSMMAAGKIIPLTS